MMQDHNQLWDLPLDTLKGKLSEKQKLLGFDLGSKTIGLSISNPGLTIATPLETLKRKKFSITLEELASIITTNEVGGFVFGLPNNMDGTAGPRVQSTRAFARNLFEKLIIPTSFWDERLSTIAVSRTLLEADLSRAKRKAVVDKLAAAYILQGALDFLTNNDLEQ